MRKNCLNPFKLLRTDLSLDSLLPRRSHTGDRALECSTGRQATAEQPSAALVRLWQLYSCSNPQNSDRCTMATEA